MSSDTAGKKFPTARNRRLRRWLALMLAAQILILGGSQVAVGSRAWAEPTAGALPPDRVVLVERVLPAQQTGYCGLGYVTRLIAVDVAGGGNRQVLYTNSQLCYPLGSVQLNPQRTQLAVTIGGSLFLLDVAAALAGTAQPRVFTESGSCDVPVWNSDGSRILCRWAWNTFLIVDPVSLHLLGTVPLDPYGIGMQDADWLPNGDLLVGGYASDVSCPYPGNSYYQPGGVWRIRMSGVQPQAAAPVLAPNCGSPWDSVVNVRVAPDGRRFAYLGGGPTGSFGSSLRGAAADGSDEHLIAAATPARAFGRFSWSLTGRYLLVEALERDETSLFGLNGNIDLVDAAAGSTRRILGATAAGDVLAPSAAEPGDNTAPTVTGIPDRLPDRGEWYRGPVSIVWTAQDPDDLPAALTIPPPTIADTEGAANPYTSLPACDPAGNCATGTVTLSLDTTPPTIDRHLPPANESGWYKQDVAATFSCADLLSGIASCSGPITVSTEGANQLVTGTALDNAGNSTTVTTAVNIDKTPPNIAATVEQAANDNGWHNGNVTIVFTCSDTLSGVRSCPGPVTVTADGADQQISGTAIDNAGNSSTSTVTVSIDSTKPTISAMAAPLNGHGWAKQTVTVTFTCADALSGISTCPEQQTLSGEGTNQSASGTAIDRAGNSSTATVTGINIDRTAPSIAATVIGTANAAGWYNSPPDIRYTCTDALSGIENCPNELHVTTEAADQAFVGQTTDNAGNQASTTTSGINLDQTPPTVTLTGASDGTSYTIDQRPTVSCATTDTLSGVAVPAHLTTSANATGTFTATCSGAVDIAGNHTPDRAVTYTLVPTSASLTSLTSQYVVASGSPNANGVTHKLANLLAHSDVCHYIADVQQETTSPNPTLTPQQAAELIYWARILDPRCA